MAGTRPAMTIEERGRQRPQSILPASPLARIARAVEAIAAAASRIALALAAVAVLLCFALVCYSVGLRYFLGQPLQWSDEVTGWLVVAIVMLAAADTQRRGENIGVDLLIERAAARLRRALAALGLLTVAAAALMMTLKGVEMVDFARMLDLRSNTLGWAALWPVQALVPVGAALMLVVALAQLLALAAGTAPDMRAADEIPKGIE